MKTIHLNPPRARLSQVLPIPTTIALVMFFLLAIAAIASRVQLASSASVTTPAAIIIIASPIADGPRPTPAAIVQVVAPPAAAQRWVTAWAAPDGAVLGPIPEPAMSAITGRYGDSWISTLHEGATVWVRVSELGGSLADLAPAMAPQVVYQVINQAQEATPAAAPAPIAPQADYQTASQQKPAGELVTAPLAEQPAQPQMIQPMYPTLAPMEQNEVTQNWAAEQYRQEHP